MMPARYSGTGGYEGIPELSGLLKPLAYGNLIRIVPTCVDPDLNLYQVHNGVIIDITHVYDLGSELMQLLDCDDLLGWVPDGLESSVGGYRTDCSRGMFRLSYKPHGKITVDCIATENRIYHGENEGYWLWG